MKKACIFARHQILCKEFFEQIFLFEPIFSTKLSEKAFNGQNKIVLNLEDVSKDLPFPNWESISKCNK